MGVQTSSNAVEGEEKEPDIYLLKEEIRRRSIEYKAANDAQCQADAEIFLTHQLEMVAKANPNCNPNYDLNYES